MSRAVFLVFAFLLTSPPTLRAEKIDSRDFSIDTYYPAPNEIRLAEERARNYWAKNAARYGSNPVYLAVETSKVFPSEVQLLWPKLINCETTASFFSQRRGGFRNLQLKCILIYDTRSGHFVCALRATEIRKKCRNSLWTGDRSRKSISGSERT